jgi:hypothetical protein
MVVPGQKNLSFQVKIMVIPGKKKGRSRPKKYVVAPVQVKIWIPQAKKSLSHKKWPSKIKKIVIPGI